MNTLTTIIISIGVAAILCRILIPFLILHSHRLGLIDKPNARKVHQKSTPVIGGLGIVLTLGLLSILLPFGEFFTSNSSWTIAVLLIFIIALLDDRFNLSAKIRLLIQLTAAIMVCYSGIRIESMFGLFGVYALPESMQYILTIVVIVGITNAFNLIDGIDGLAGGFTFINFLVLGVLSFFLNQQLIMLLCFSIAGATLSFLKYNFHPASIFMGDAGSMTIGFILSTLSIILLQEAEGQYYISPFSVITGILILPVTDAIRVFLGRYIKRLSMFNPDKTHLHHLLLEQGKSHRKASLFILAFHLFLILVGCVLCWFISPTTSILILVGIQLSVSKLFVLYKLLKDWGGVIKRQEFLRST